MYRGYYVENQIKLLFVSSLQRIMKLSFSHFDAIFSGKKRGDQITQEIEFTQQISSAHQHFIYSFHNYLFAEMFAFGSTSLWIYVQNVSRIWNIIFWKCSILNFKLCLFFIFFLDLFFNVNKSVTDILTNLIFWYLSFVI